MEPQNFRVFPLTSGLGHDALGEFLDFLGAVGLNAFIESPRPGWRATKRYPASAILSGLLDRVMCPGFGEK